MKSVIDLRHNLAANRNRIVIRVAQIEQAIFDGRVYCRICGKTKASHASHESDHEFFAFEQDDLAAYREAVALLEQLGRLEVRS